MNPEDTSAHEPQPADQTPGGLFGPAAEQEPEGSGLPMVWRWAIGVAIVALLAYPVVRSMGHGDEGSDVAGQPGAGNLLNVSLQQYQAGHYEAAIAAAQAFLKVNPNSAEAYSNIAVSYLGLKKYDEAIQSAQQALRVNPDFQLAKNNLAWIQQEKAKADGKAPAAGAITPEYFLNQSLTLYQAGRYQESIDAARQALKLRPEYAEAYNNLGAAYASMGKWDEAIQNAQQALRINPNFQLAKNNLAWALAQKAKPSGKP